MMRKVSFKVRVLTSTSGATKVRAGVVDEYGEWVPGIIGEGKYEEYVLKDGWSVGFEGINFVQKDDGDKPLEQVLVDAYNSLERELEYAQEGEKSESRWADTYKAERDEARAWARRLYRRVQSLEEELAVAYWFRDFNNKIVKDITESIDRMNKSMFGKEDDSE